QRSIQALTQLKHSTQADADLRQILRQFEMRLLHDLGYFMDYSCDFQQQDIVPTQHYHYHVEQGFIACMPSRNSFLGADIQSMQQYDEQQDLNPQQVAFLTLFYRQVLNHLLADKPLKSRQLWIQHKSK
ncbi:MAG: DNA repair protein RecO C-terminal domain-containing protein, partial [Acinetobacter sp.]|nr:DNA repair protein RecO C-terminal domain-containing protein [Acinetobacter sp.]